MNHNAPHHSLQPLPLRRAISTPARRRGFTLIELLVVIGILVILIAISVIAFRFVGDRTKGNATRVTLETLKGLTQEAETAGGLKRQPTRVWANNDNALSAPAATSPSSYSTIFPSSSVATLPDLWRRSDITGLPTPLGSPESPLTSLWSPGNVTVEVFNPAAYDRFSYGGVRPPPPPSLPMPRVIEFSNWRESAAIKNTAIAFAMLRNVPGVRRSLDSLPNTGAKFASFWSSSATYLEGSLVIFDPINSADQVASAAASVRGPSVYKAVRGVAVGVAPTAGTDSIDWQRSSATVPDSFGNPIIFVPASGLHLGGRFDSSKSYDVGERTFAGEGAARIYYECIARPQSPPIVTPVTNTSYWRVATPIRSPDGKPFWASAGPDGTFDTAGDNLYSFEN